MLEPVSLEEATALVDQVRVGRRDLQSVPGYPMLVVDLGGQAPGAASAIAPSTGWPIVVVGVGAASAPSTGAGPDLFLTRTSDPPAPWVSTGDELDRTLLDLHEAVSANLQASATLVQVLRSTETSTVESALVAESLAYAALQGGAEHRKWLQELSRPSPDEDPSPCVVLERDGSALRIALNRPARRNAYSSRMRDELIQALELAAADESIALVEMRGNGPNFCSGGDLAEFGSVEDTATAHWIRMQRSAGWRMHLLSQRAVVHVHGACVGAGVELPAFAGTVVARSDASFALPEVKMGLIPGAGGTASLPRRIGRQRTAWLALTGYRLAAKDAHEWGLVDELAGSAD